MRRRSPAAALALAASAAAQKPGVQSGNMNGKYAVVAGGAAATQNVPFNDDYSTKGNEYFDVWAPEIATHYGQVFWTSQGPHPLPDDIVQRFKGRVIAITGYEQDQVMVTPTGHPGEHPDRDVSVPINWAYNHHYEAWMTGQHSELKEVAAGPDDPVAHGRPTKLVAVERPSAALRGATAGMPTSWFISEGNGGESRRSFHGYPDGYAQLLDSPQTWHLTPMQIDTRNRDCGVRPEDVGNCTEFVPGPEPRQARYGRPGTGGPYSGILECPCNGRFGGDPIFYPNSSTKVVQHNYKTLVTGACPAAQAVGTAAECFAAAPALHINASHISNETVSDPKRPPGCSVVVRSNGSGVAYFNRDAAAKAECGGGSAQTGEASEAGVSFSLRLDPAAAPPPPPPPPPAPPSSECDWHHDTGLNGTDARTVAAASKEACCGACRATPGCAAADFVYGSQCHLKSAYAPKVRKDGSVACVPQSSVPAGKTPLLRPQIREPSVHAAPAGTATITLTGPADAWFGVGLGAVTMNDQPYTFLVNESGVWEQKIGTCGTEADHCPGTRLSSSISVVSNTVSGGRRTAVVTRPLKGATKDHYSFDPDGDATIQFIAAVGSTPVFAYHQSHAASDITLDARGGTCVCEAGTAGLLCTPSETNCIKFTKACEPEPNGDLLGQHNPTCDSVHYGGGLNCCHHGRIMLDADQEVRPELLRYHMKFRFWFKEYKANATRPNGVAGPSHYDLPRIYYQTEWKAGEYDVPPAFRRRGDPPIVGYPTLPFDTMTPGTSCTGNCPYGADCECLHTIMYHWTLTSSMRLIYAGPHCHAPSCHSMEMFRTDTGELLCRVFPQYGSGNFPADRFDEKGYLALPPCLWGDDEGLQGSVLLPPGTPMVSVKRNRNTWSGHFGEMASWQMRGVDF